MNVLYPAHSYHSILVTALGLLTTAKEWEGAKTETGPGTFPKSHFLSENLLPVNLQQLY